MAVGIRTNTDSETLDTSPGGLFTNPDDVTSIDLSTVEGHLNDAVDGARNSKGWAVGNPDDPLDGWSSTNNSKYYSEQSSNSATEAAASATSAAGSASSAATSAGAAGVSASQAAASASSALSSAQTATEQAGIATTQAGLASDSAMAAATSATASANSAEEARLSAAAAAEDSDLIAIELAEARALAVEVRQLHAEVASDSEELHELEIRVRMDSEQIARDVARAEVIFAEIDSEAQVAEAFAVGTGPQAGEGANIDTEMDGFDITSTQDLFSVGGTQFVRVEFPTIPGVSYGDVPAPVDGGGTIALRIVTEAFDSERVVRVFHNYEDLGNKPSTAFDGGANSVYSAIRVSELTRTPIATDTFHVFVTDPGKVPAWQSAWFQAQRASEFQDEARQFDSDARARDSEINSLVDGANARIDSEKVVRRLADEALQREIDSDVAALRGDIREIIDSDIRHIHARINEVVVVGYGLDYIEADSDIIVDSDVIASVRKLDSEIFAARAYTDEEIANLIGASPGIYTTLTRIREALDSDETVLDSLVAYMDSDRVAREELADRLQRDVDSDAQAVRDIGARIDSEQRALRADIDSDATAIRRLDGRIDSEKVVRAAEDTVLNNRIDSEIRNLHRRVSGVVDVGYGLQYNTTDSDIFVDSDIIASRRYVDSEIRAQEQADSEIHTRIDSEIAALASRDSELFARLENRLDSDGRALGSFTRLDDTPGSYDSEAGDYVRVNSGETALEFFNPFPVANNRLTTLNGMRIRSFDNTNGAIIFATFTPTQRVNSQTLNWDQAVGTFGVAFTNPSDITDEYIQEVTDFRVGTTQITGFTTNNTPGASGTLTSNQTFVSNQAWDDGSSDNFAITATVRSNLGNSFTATAGSLTWRAWQAAGSTDIGNQLFDTVDTSYTATLTIQNMSTPANAGDAIFTPANAQSGGTGNAVTVDVSNNTPTATFNNVSILSNTRVQGNITGVATKPSTVIDPALDSDYQYTASWDSTPNTQHRVWFIVSAAGTTPTFATPGNGGYTNPTGTIIRNDRTTSLARGRNQYGNGQSNVSLYVIGNGTINTIQETTNTAFPIDQTVPTPTQLTLGHTNNTFDYNVYEIPLADNAGNFYTIT